MNEMVTPLSTNLQADRSQCFRVCDFLEKNDVALDSPDDQLLPSDILIHGDFLHTELRPGLVLHCSDVIEERPFTAKSVIQAGLSCIFFVKGSVDLTLGDRQFCFTNNDVRAVSGTAIMSTCSEQFERTCRNKQQLCHIVVSASPEWLDLDGMRAFEGKRHGKAFLSEHLGEHTWQLKPRTAELIGRILRPSPLIPQLHNLLLEALAVELITDSLTSALASSSESNRNLLLNRHDRVKLERALEFIRYNLETVTTVDCIARAAGMSASGLQRLFRMSQGMSVFEYVRQQRLEQAYTALQKNDVTIQEASIMAGYSNAANFATAFRRRFDATPKEIARKGF